MNTPEVIMTLILSLNVILTLYKLGKNQDVKDFITSIIALTILVILLVWGGFYN